jgi:hypothetical protein
VCPLRTPPLNETCAVDQPTYCPHVDHSIFHSPASVDRLREATLLPRVEMIFGDMRAHQQEEECSCEARVWHSTTMAEECKVGRSDLGRVWRIQNRGGSSRPFALSTILHQDPRYFPSHKRTFIARTWYSATRVVVTRNDNGDSTFNTSEFLGALATSALQNAHYPRHDRSFGDTMNRLSGALISDAIGDLQREFTPDMKRLFRRHAPKKILQIEEQIPIPAEDKP